MKVAEDRTGVATWGGTPKEVQARLGRSHADQVLVLAFDKIDGSVFETLAANVSSVASSMFDVLLQRHDNESLERLAEVLVPRAPVAPRLLKEAAMWVKARRAVLDSGDWLTAAQIAELAGLSRVNPSTQPNKWKRQGAIFAIHHNGVDYFPGFGLDPGSQFRPVKALAKVIEAFGGHKDGWGMAYWFHSDNGFLGGQRPQDLLATEPERVIEAARDEVQDIAHG
ncbi:hypothetical protein [Acidovorax sp. PRC11]|nr:hypothetical protein [Acidovorax sp. PRC11]MDT0136252.1 hypothetical protein [Acidovorax sp. PRC11]